ncbi:branched-chain amino acid ABC transporter permease [Halorubellus litoreus]|uniref:Branched-chain amino acid ABC transporter permease n=1 Tax=Halorubellus litoreus TaxID=755308 RepID=A0ABD5VLV6_9EURY
MASSTETVLDAVGNPTDRTLFYAAIVVGALLIWGVTFLVNTFWIKVLYSLYMFVALAAAWNYLSGYTGYPTFGPMMFIGIGAYGTVFFSIHMNFPWYAALAGAAIVGVVAAAITGFILLRLNGIYFAIGTLLFAEAVHEAILIEDNLLGGSGGVNLSGTSLTVTYLLFAALALVSIVVTYETATRTFGLRMLAIREDEEALRAVGVNPLKYKMSAFCVHGLLTTLTGGAFALSLGFVFPGTVFSVDITITLILIAILGGIGTVWGPVLGALVLIPMQELLWLEFPNLNLILLGLFLVLVIVQMPEGIISKLKDMEVLPRTRQI